MPVSGSALILLELDEGQGGLDLTGLLPPAAPSRIAPVSRSSRGPSAGSVLVPRAQVA